MLPVWPCPAAGPGPRSSAVCGSRAPSVGARVMGGVWAGQGLIIATAPATTTLHQRCRNAAETLSASTLAPCFPAISRCQHRAGVLVRVGRVLRSLLGEQGRAEGLFQQCRSLGEENKEQRQGQRGHRLPPVHSTGLGRWWCLPPSQPCHPSDKLREPFSLSLSVCLSGRLSCWHSSHL